MADKNDQMILCIESEYLFTDSHPKWDGLKTDQLDELYALLLEKSEFRRRGDLEEDPSYKQIIPQVVLKHKDKYFLHKQVAGGESRLNALCPLPLGGHVEEFDLGQDKDLIQSALERELFEEADVKSNIINREFLGLIYIEDENPVNHVHVGLAYIFDLDGDDVKIKETDKLEDVGFVDVDYLRKNIDTLTYWSRVIVDKL